MAKIVCRKGNGEVNIEVSGEATIGNALKVRDMFINIAGGTQSTCRINLSDITDIDLSFFQLLLSFRKSMLKDNKTFTVDPLPPDHIFNRFVRDTGFNESDLFHGGNSHGI